MSPPPNPSVPGAINLAWDQLTAEDILGVDTLGPGSAQATLRQIAIFLANGGIEPIEAPIVGGVVTLDLSAGDFFYTTINANITSFDIINANSGAAFVWQSIGNGSSFTQSFGSIRWPSAGVPVLTIASGKVDTYTFIKRADWFGFVSGQNS